MTIKEYYEQLNAPDFIVENKLRKLDTHADIKREFEEWINTGDYLENGVEVEGYTAQKLSSVSRLLSGESAFMALIDLREKPESTIRMINSDLRIK